MSTSKTLFFHCLRLYKSQTLFITYYSSCKTGTYGLCCSSNFPSYLVVSPYSPVNGYSNTLKSHLNRHNTAKLVVTYKINFHYNIQCYKKNEMFPLRGLWGRSQTVVLELSKSNPVRLSRYNATTRHVPFDYCWQQPLAKTSEQPWKDRLLLVTSLPPQLLQSCFLK